jgi:hypothetical protein
MLEISDRFETFDPDGESGGVAVVEEEVQLYGVGGVCPVEEEPSEPAPSEPGINYSCPVQ